MSFPGCSLPIKSQPTLGAAFARTRVRDQRYFPRSAVEEQNEHLSKHRRDEIIQGAQPASLNKGRDSGESDTMPKTAILFSSPRPWLFLR